jgi:hypothetical protein
MLPADYATSAINSDFVETAPGIDTEAAGPVDGVDEELGD